MTGPLPTIYEGEEQDGSPFYRLLDGETGNPWRGPLTLADAAFALGVTAATLRQQIANGKLRARKIGRDWTVTSREVERYARENKR